MKKKIVPFILSIILLLGSSILPTYASVISDLNDKKSEVQDDISDTKQEQQQVKEELTEQMKEIATLDNSIDEVEAQIRELQNQIDTLEKSIQEKQKELDKKQEEHDKNQALMEDRLVVMYETGETSFLDMLFSSKNIVEFISNYYLLTQVTECDKELLDTIEKEQEEISNTKKKLEEEKEQNDSAKKEKQTKSNLLKSQKTERQQKANALSDQEKQLQNKIDEDNKKLAQIEAQIAEELKKIQDDVNKNGGSAGIHFDGSFIWPCNNRIVTSTVKNRWGRKHKGIDIGARYENVYATASGYAYPLENPGGYGHYIIIIHGNNYMSLYGHLNSFKVSYGQYVSQGQVIAQSGNTGSSTAPHLHFELRRASSISGFFNVSPLNPLDYLGGGYTLAAGATVES